MDDPKIQLFKRPAELINTDFRGGKIMKRLVVFASVIMLCAFISSSALGSDLKVGTLFDHTGALKDWGPHFQHTTELAAKQVQSL